MIELKKNNIKKYETEEQLEVKKFIYVLLGLIIVIIGIYFFTRAFITKDLFNNKSDEIVYNYCKVIYDTVIVGTMLNRADSEYYVLAFSNDDNQAIYYNTIADSYINKKEAKKMYYLDLSNELNKKYVASDDNISTKFTNIDELKFGIATIPDAPRLACVKPVASVHPEPGSNSSLLFISFLFFFKI